MFELPKTGWIWLPNWTPRAVPTLALFRKQVVLDTVPAALPIRISADARYKLYINGTFVSYGPAKGDRTDWYYDEIDIAPALKSGKNVISVEVLAFPEGVWNHSLFHSATPGLYITENVSAPENGLPPYNSSPEEITAAILGGGTYSGYGVATRQGWKCRMDEGYKLRPEMPVFAPLCILEEWKALPQNQNWKNPGYCDDGWSDAANYDVLAIQPGVSPANLSPRPIPPMILRPGAFCEVCGKHTEHTEAWNNLLRNKGAVTVLPHTEEIVEFSAGEEMTAFLSLRVAGGQGAKIEILSSEGYVRSAGDPLSGTKTVKGDRIDWEHGTLEGYTDVFYPSGAGSLDIVEEYTPFWFRTFRFVRLTIRTGEEPLTICGFDYLETGYPLEVKTQVFTSDPSLEGIWDISLRSLRRCMQETYTDCPFYEQLQYIMDSRSQALFTYTVSADDRLARQCMEYFRRSQRPDGVLNNSYPNTRFNVIPTFSIFYILMLHDHMMYFGDKDFLREHLGCVDGVLQYFNRNLRSDGLVGQLGTINVGLRYWSFIDWSPAWMATSGMPPAGLAGPLTIESLLYVLGLQKAAEVLDYTDRPDTAQEYRNRAEAVQAAIRTFCCNESGFYMDSPGIPMYSVHSQVFAILTDTVSVEEGKRLLADALDEPGRFAQCSISMYFYLFRALEKVGLYERTAELWDLWRDMLKSHLTTCVENDTDQRSDCHAWGSLALYELPAVILGVRPMAPGFETAVIQPVPGILTHAEGTVVTPKGSVTVKWARRGDRKIEFDYAAPPGMRVDTSSGKFH